MHLHVAPERMERIKNHLFRDEKENMVLGICEARHPGDYSVAELFFPGDGDFTVRTALLITLKAEAVYPLLKKMGGYASPAFLQIHCHTGRSMLFFSSVDNKNNGFNTSDIREFHPASEFFRLLFVPGGRVLGERYDYRKKRFQKLKVRTV